jgi:hypothetical protein
MAEMWIGKARKSMEERGTVGKFGKATPKKIAAGKAAGGLRAKEATFAANMKRIAQKRASKKRS